eukprot:TRINITY_DN5056_c0_g1_i1.p1 TRINITY_DN5056_c0_g1~~TRINITY_DN5056_c0_g1_i1.p1  ORF type:complete len:299 (+),score=55.13 TRINITY_DN5056_c0_g1_i1:72-968(+)
MSSSTDANATFFRHQTRATQFQQKFAFPPGFPDLLKSFTREALREQPANIPAWAAEYFARLAIGQRTVSSKAAARPGGPPVLLPSAVGAPTYAALQELQGQVIAALSGHAEPEARLPIDVARRLLQEHFELPHPHTLYLLSLLSDSATVSARAVDVPTFAAVAAPALYCFCTVPFDFTPVTHAGEDHVHGHAQSALVATVLQALLRRDEQQSGRVHLQEYIDVLRGAPVDLTERDVAALVAEAGVDADGAVDYRAELQGRVYPLLKLVEAFGAFEAAVASGELEAPVPLGMRMPELQA